MYILTITFKPIVMKGKGKVRKPKETEYVMVHKNDPFRRGNLLANARIGVGKVTEKDGNVVMRCGTESYGYVVYTIVDAKLNE